MPLMQPAFWELIKASNAASYLNIDAICHKGIEIGHKYLECVCTSLVLEITSGKNRMEQNMFMYINLYINAHINYIICIF